MSAERFASPLPGALAGELVARFGSPLFVYDGAAVRERWRQLRAAMPPRVRIHFAAKANPALGILALLRSLGAGVEIASRGELLAALRAGFAPADILWAGPAKTDAEHEAAAEAGIAAIHAESDAELRRLDALGLGLGRAIAGGVRVHVPWGAGEATRIIGGSGATKFGIPEGEALERAPSWARLQGVRARSVHVFNASNVRDAAALAGAWERTLRLALRLRGLGLPVEQVDLGGGLGVPADPSETPLDVAALGRSLASLLDELARDGFAPSVAIEPGRFLVAECGTYLTTVVDVKTCAGVTFLTCDGGVHHLLRPALVGQPHPIARADGRASSAADRRRVRVTGPLCTSLDDLGEHDLPACTAPGDLLAVGLAGAYGFTESMPLFLSHPRPAEVLLLDGRPHLLRPRLEPEDLLTSQRVPPELETGSGLFSH